MMNIEEKKNSALNLMRNIPEGDQPVIEKVEIFDENNNDVIPITWGRRSQTATCRKCGKTGETLVKRKFGIGNICCGFCFFALCIWCAIPFVCCLANDTIHLCANCKSTVGSRSFI